MYRPIVLPLLVFMGASLSTAYNTAQAAFPDDQAIEYRIRETPNAPESAVVFTITLYLTAGDVDGDEVGWEIEEIRFRQPISQSLEILWIEASPVVDSPDGLWWVEHADPQDPQIGEFDMPPLLTGTADAEYSEDPDLHYSFEGVAYVSPPSPPFQDTVALDYILTLAGEDDPIEEGDDEPVEPDEGVHDPD